ncbi:MAG TPA: ATP-dependent helicase, partial [Kiritimatiellae bacterium]|nr:ATP-dependent helicase [Kiritimatiellia bacterium]
TFHHLANRILRRYASLIGYGYDYSILDRDDARSLIRECIRGLGIRSRHFPKPEVLSGLFSIVRNRGGDLEEAAADRFDTRWFDVRDVCRVHTAYQERKKRINAMDFDDLIINVVTLMETHPEVLERYQQQFEHILVDEYQDTNRLQARWIDMLAAGRQNLLVVGDDFQSIYGWRGAEYRNILEFPQRYPETRIYMLETNYRSTPEILEVANVCISGNPEQFQKRLRPVRRGDGHRPVAAFLLDGHHQAAYVIDVIYGLQAEGIPAGEIAVLYRAHYHAMELQLEMFRRQIPYLLISGVRFFEQMHIKDVCTVVRLAHNPRDSMAFSRLLRLLGGVGERTAEKIWAALGESFDPLDRERQQEVGHRLPAAAQLDWSAIGTALLGCRKESSRIAAGDLIQALLDAFYREYALENFTDAERRLEDIAEVIRFAATFPDIESFVSQSGLLTNLEAETDHPAHAGTRDAVRLSTIHQAKGLEWTAVIILWLVHGMFPSQLSVGEDAVAEERRLFYVAVTRARSRLFLCCPRRRRERTGAVSYCEPSPFLAELPDGVVDVRREIGSYW